MVGGGIAIKEHGVPIQRSWTKNGYRQLVLDMRPMFNFGINEYESIESDWERYFSDQECYFVSFLIVIGK